MIIFVAGPYSAKTEEGRIANAEAAMAAGLEILGKSHAPFIPHLTHYFDVWAEGRVGQRLPASLYYGWDLKILEKCDALLYLAPSPGANRELARAQELGLVVFYSLREIPFADEFLHVLDVSTG